MISTLVSQQSQGSQAPLLANILPQGLLGVVVPLLTQGRGQGRGWGDSSSGEPTWLVAWISSWAFALLARLASSILKRSAVTAGGGELMTGRPGVDRRRE